MIDLTGGGADERWAQLVEQAGKMPRTDRRAAADAVLWWCSETGSGHVKDLAGVCDQARVPAWDTIRGCPRSRTWRSTGGTAAGRSANRC